MSLKLDRWGGNTKETGIQKYAFLCRNCPYLFCWDNSRICNVTQVHFEACSSDRSDPHFSTRTERCVISTESRSRGGADDSSVTGWTKPQQHETFSFTDVYFHVVCDVLDEFTDCNRCVSWSADLGRVASCLQHKVWRYFWESGNYPKLFFAELQKTKTLKNSAAAYFYTLGSFCSYTKAWKQIFSCFVYPL